MTRKRFDSAPQINVKDEGLLIQQVAGSTVNLLEVKSSAGATLVSVDYTGATTLSGSVSLPAGSITSTMIADGTIVNADINTAAAIALSKLASGTAGQVVIANASGVPTFTTLSGDITVSNTGVVTIAADSVILGTDTTGAYVASLVAGTGISLTNNTGEGATPTITNSGVTGLTGTANQVTVSASTGSVTLSLPQNIHTGATPTFATLTTSGNINYTSSNLVWMGGGVWDEDANWSGVGSPSGNRILMRHTTDSNMYIISRSATVKIRSTSGGGDYTFSNSSFDTGNRPVIAGTSYVQAGSTGVTDAGSVSASNWFRSTGGSGWYNNTYGGGIWMSDSTYVRVYGSKIFVADAGVTGTAQYGSYGSISLRGTTNGYAGLSNPDTSSAFMWTNNICGHYYNNNSWNWYFDRGVLYLQGDGNMRLTWNNNNSGLPWHYGPTLVGWNGWSYYSTYTGQFEMGQRYSTGDGSNYAWSRGGLLIGSTPNDSWANQGTLTVYGSAAKSSGGSSWAVWSDARLKSNIQTYTKGLQEVIALTPKSFVFNGKNGTTEGEQSVGLIAQEVELVFPDTVKTCELDPLDDVQDPKLFNYNEINFALINAIKELNARIERLENA